MTEPLANAAQIGLWSAAVGETWVKLNAGLDRQLEPIGTAMIDGAELRPGHAVLDVGCGAGATSRQAAERVGPSGSVLGVDISTPLLELARSRSCGPDAASPTFLEADAQTHAFTPASFDRLISRFGVMFFEAPETAFANLRAAMREGGTLTFACWREAGANPWLVAPLNAARHLFPAQPPEDPAAPGPMAFADPDRVRGILAGAGWKDVDVRALDLEIGGGGLEETTYMMMRVGPVGRLIREAGATPELMAEVETLVTGTLRQYLKPDGRVMVPSGSWIVSAKA